MRIRSLLSILVLTSTFACSATKLIIEQPRPVVIHQLSPAEIAKQTQNAVVALASYSNKEHVYCTATWVSKTELITAAHCVEDLVQNDDDVKKEECESTISEDKNTATFCIDEDPPVVDKNFHIVNNMAAVAYYYTANEYQGAYREPKFVHPVRVTAIDIDHDIASLLILVSSPPHGYVKLAERTPEVGDTIYSMGHPQGLSWSFTAGVVGAYRENKFKPVESENTGPYLQGSIQIASGNSGGGIFDRDGNYVGLTVMAPKIPLTALFVHLDTVKDFLRKSRLQWK